MANDNNGKTRPQMPGRTADEAAFERQLAEGASTGNPLVAVNESSVGGSSPKPPAVSAMEYKDALTKFTPEARQLVAQVAADRQYNKNPARQKNRYRVDGCNELVEAFDEIDAIAVANDLIKTNRGPRNVKAELVGA
jgi:hypothetical protein